MRISGMMSLQETLNNFYYLNSLHGFRNSEDQLTKLLYFALPRRSTHFYIDFVPKRFDHASLVAFIEQYEERDLDFIRIMY